MATPGSYVLDVELSRPVRLRVGRLGTSCFPQGRYLYVGSAMGGLEGRVSRHARGGRLHWHVDYLLRKGQLRGAWVCPSLERLECLFAQVLVEAREEAQTTVVMQGFGSSDCRCSAHLFFAEESLDLPRVLSSVSDVPLKYWSL
jgi:Uri superfamily endonuclease